MEFWYSNKFKKSSQKIIKSNPKMKVKINACLKDFKKNLLYSKYYRRKLKWYKNHHELALTWDMRIIFHLLIKDWKCYFLNIWTHSELETSSKKKNKF